MFDLLVSYRFGAGAAIVFGRSLYGLYTGSAFFIRSLCRRFLPRFIPAILESAYKKRRNGQ
jgi:hypothetical protein